MEDSNGKEIKEGGEVSYTIKYKEPLTHEVTKEHHRFPVVEFKGVLCLENKQGAKFPVSYFTRFNLIYHDSLDNSDINSV